MTYLSIKLFPFAVLNYSYGWAYICRMCIIREDAMRNFRGDTGWIRGI